MGKEVKCYICFNETGGICNSFGMDEFFRISPSCITSAEKLTCSNCGTYYISGNGGNKLMEIGIRHTIDERLIASQFVKSHPNLVIVGKFFKNQVIDTQKRLNREFFSVEELYEKSEDVLKKVCQMSA